MRKIFLLLLFVGMPLFAANDINALLDQLKNVDTTLKILALFTILSLAPAILITMTSFTRIVIVLGLLRQALGIPQSPPNQVIIALSLFLTFFIMKPVFDQIYVDAVQPYMQHKMSDMEAVEAAMKPIKKFLVNNTQKEELKLFLDINKTAPKNYNDISLSVLLPAFLVSEIKIAFEIAFVIFLPFLVIDMLVASILMSMGMMMIPPMMISLPFKLILFILSDGWELLIKALIKGYQ
ncbi:MULTISPECIES: flagellar type III secretion system pore protein FliP [unclassified Nitratiruptor]|uniref:flagellar type III secretion system pore protein FliP n=1 Tax=unclassified Nitratiruptor TaxID=2624044 RepID=UPI001916047A|nr:MULTISPECIES: flagellar type III secretion system pore protein FliP [unclassified Nitratiruptor]BCD59931.1 flagellar biosynthetic protein FliP [Nitratiruptor sp. YY08-10]BCD63854.1 flagellar biosynthetic protein FliP [Nitratiruptor sp. YY08-14]